MHKGWKPIHLEILCVFSWDLLKTLKIILI